MGSSWGMIRFGHVAGSKEQESSSLKRAAKNLRFRIRFMGSGILVCGSMQI